MWRSCSCWGSRLSGHEACEKHVQGVAKVQTEPYRLYLLHQGVDFLKCACSKVVTVQHFCFSLKDVMGDSEYEVLTFRLLWDMNWKWVFVQACKVLRLDSCLHRSILQIPWSPSHLLSVLSSWHWVAQLWLSSGEIGPSKLHLLSSVRVYVSWQIEQTLERRCECDFKVSFQSIEYHPSSRLTLLSQPVLKKSSQTGLKAFEDLF